MMRFSLLLAAAVALPSLAMAQPQTPTTPTTPPGAGAKADDVKINQLIVYGNDACPQSTDDQINICARLPDEDRYRIPPDLRDDPGNPARESWSRKVERLEMAGRTGIASCSPVGPGAGAGCLSQLILEARDEYRNSDVNWTRLIEEARRGRLGRIDEESEEIDRELKAQGR
jgi:hypothetical protein